MLVIPEPIFNDPDCPFCYDGLISEDGTGWYCNGCNLAWSIDGSHGERLHEELDEHGTDKNQCECVITVRPGHGYVEGMVNRSFRCVLDLNHPLPHRGYCEVKDDYTGYTHAWYYPSRDRGGVSVPGS